MAEEEKETIEGIFGPRVERELKEKTVKKLKVFKKDSTTDLLPFYVLQEKHVVVSEILGKAVRESPAFLALSGFLNAASTYLTYATISSISSLTKEGSLLHNTVDENSVKYTALTAAAAVGVSGLAYLGRRAKKILDNYKNNKDKKKKAAFLHEKINNNFYNQETQGEFDCLIKDSLKEIEKHALSPDQVNEIDNLIVSSREKYNLINDSKKKYDEASESKSGLLRKELESTDLEKVKKIIGDYNGSKAVIERNFKRIEDILESAGKKVERITTKDDISKYCTYLKELNTDIDSLVELYTEHADKTLFDKSFNHKAPLREKEAGLRLKLPFYLERSTLVSQKENFFNPAYQNAYTEEKIPVIIDAIVSVRINNPEKAKYAITNLEEAVFQYADAFLRNQVAQMKLNEVSGEEKHLLKEFKEYIQDGYNEKGEKEFGRNIEDDWGIEYVDLKIEKVYKPLSIEEANTNHAAAEREGQAKIIAAELEGQARVIAAKKEAEAYKKLESVLGTEEGKVYAILKATQDGKINPTLISESGLEGMASALFGAKEGSKIIK